MARVIMPYMDKTSDLIFVPTEAILAELLARCEEGLIAVSEFRRDTPGDDGHPSGIRLTWKGDWHRILGLLGYATLRIEHRIEAQRPDVEEDFDG